MSLAAWRVSQRAFCECGDSFRTLVERGGAHGIVIAALHARKQQPVKAAQRPVIGYEINER